MIKKKILIVEDDASMQDAVSTYLTNQGFTTVLAKDGEEGLSLALKEHPDLTLLDILIPKIDGMGMMQKLRQDEWGKTALIIILTNVSPNENNVVNSVLQHQPAYYLMKSDVKLEGILEKIKEVLKID